MTADGWLSKSQADEIKAQLMAAMSAAYSCGIHDDDEMCVRLMQQAQVKAFASIDSLTEPDHQCDGENDWCDACEAREKALGPPAARVAPEPAETRCSCPDYAPTGDEPPEGDVNCPTHGIDAFWEQDSDA